MSFLLIIGVYLIGYMVCLCGTVFCYVLDDEDPVEVAGPMMFISLFWPIVLPVGITVKIAEVIRDMK